MDIDRIAREIKILKKIRHPYIIQLYQIIETDNELYLIMEHANAGELFDYIVRHSRVDDITASKFLDMILLGVEHLHKNGVCHRDLKPENLLLEKDTATLKIIDFGLSNLYAPPNEPLHTACGSPCYAAPEMIAGKPYVGLQVDIWSCGIILYAMICGYLPFEDPNTDKLYKKILNCEYTFPSDINPEAKDLIKKILNTNPQERYTLEQIRSHPWFAKNLMKSRRLQPQSSKLKLDAFTPCLENSESPKDIKVNPKLVIDMVQNYKIPVKQKSGDKTSEPFSIDHILYSLAHNKHNDSTTTYYLLHKKWLQNMDRPASKPNLKDIRHQEQSMTTLTPSNYQQLAFKLQSQLDMQENQGDRVKNMINVEESNRIKLTESASLVIKSPQAFQQKNEKRIAAAGG